MKRGFVFLAVILVFLAGTADVFAEGTISRLGRAPLMGSVKDELDLAEKIEKKKDKLIAGVRLADPSLDAAEVVNQILHQVKGGHAVYGDCPRGTYIIWMLYETSAGVQVLREKITEMDEMKGWIVTVDVQGRTLHLFFPEACGNLSLLPLPVEPPPPVVSSPPPPPEPPPAQAQPTVINNYCVQKPAPPPVIVNNFCPPVLPPVCPPPPICAPQMPQMMPPPMMPPPIEYAPPVQYAPQPYYGGGTPLFNLDLRWGHERHSSRSYQHHGGLHPRQPHFQPRQPSRPSRPSGPAFCPTTGPSARPGGRR